MDADFDLRLQAGSAVTRYLGKAANREFFRRNGYRSGDQIVTVLESDTVTEVLERVRAYNPPVTVAIFWPSTSKLAFVTMDPGELIEDSPGQDQVGGQSTIGMLHQYVSTRSNQRYTFRPPEMDQPLMVSGFHAYA